MSDRHFYVEDGGQVFTLRPQLSGITQGCTLGPLLFIVVISAVMYDAVQMPSPSTRAAYGNVTLADIVSADDLLLLGAPAKHVEEFLRAVSGAGRAYGLELHARKLQLLPCDQNASKMTYLGATFAAEGRGI